MSAPYKELQDRAPVLAKTVIFDKPEERDAICDILQLGLELEKIIEIASEPMLAMIRMQWWLDLFAKSAGDDDVSPLAQRLTKRFGNEYQELLTALQNTQDSLQTPSHYVDWPGLFTVIDQHLGWQADPQMIAQLGRNMAALYQEQGSHHYHSLDDKIIKQATATSHGFYRLINMVLQRQMDGKPADDHLLIFRCLWRVLR